MLRLADQRFARCAQFKFIQATLQGNQDFIQISSQCNAADILVENMLLKTLILVIIDVQFFIQDIYKEKLLGSVILKGAFTEL